MGGPDPLEQCLGAVEGHQMLLGDFFVVPQDADVEVIGAGLSDAQGIEVERAWLAAPLDGALGASEYPPVDSPAWESRQDISGARALVGHNNVILLIKRTAPVEGTASSIHVEYRLDGVDYSVHGTTTLVMKDDCIHTGSASPGAL